MSTLRFGVSAKKIENKVSANLQIQKNEESLQAVIQQYEATIKDLAQKNKILSEQIIKLENETQTIQQLSSAIEQDENPTIQLSQQPGARISISRNNFLNFEMLNLVKAFKLAKKELYYCKQKIKYFEENLGSIIKRHSETYSRLFEVCYKKKGYKNKLKEENLKMMVLGQNENKGQPKNASDLDKMINYMCSLKLDGVSGIDSDFIQQMEHKVMSCLDHIKFAKIKLEMKDHFKDQKIQEKTPSKQDLDNFSTQGSISDDEELLENLMKSVVVNESIVQEIKVEDDDNVKKKKKKSKKRIIIQNSEDLDIIERDIKNKYPKKDSFQAREDENLQEMFRLNIQDCDKKIYPIEELLNSLESKHINDLLEKFLQEKKDRQKKEVQDDGQEQQQEDDYEEYLYSDQEGNMTRRHKDQQDQENAEQLDQQDQDSVIKQDEQEQKLKEEEEQMQKTLQNKSFGMFSINDIKRQIMEEAQKQVAEEQQMPNYNGFQVNQPRLSQNLYEKEYFQNKDSNSQSSQFGSSYIDHSNSNQLSIPNNASSNQPQHYKMSILKPQGFSDYYQSQQNANVLNVNNSKEGMNFKAQNPKMSIVQSPGTLPINQRQEQKMSVALNKGVTFQNQKMSILETQGMNFNNLNQKKSILQNSGIKLSQLLKLEDLSKFNQNLWFEVDGIYMSLEEIQQIRVSEQLSPLVDEFLEDVYSNSLFLLRYLEWDTNNSTYQDFKNIQVDPLNIKRGSSVVKVRTQSIDQGGFASSKRKQSVYPETLQEAANEDEEDDINEDMQPDVSIDDLRQKALSKVSNIGSKSSDQFSSHLGVNLGFKNHLKVKSEGMQEASSQNEQRKSQNYGNESYPINLPNSSSNQDRNNQKVQFSDNQVNQQNLNSSDFTNNSNNQKNRFESEVIQNSPIKSQEYFKEIKPKNLSDQFEKADQNETVIPINRMVNLQGTLSFPKSNISQTNSRLTSLQMTQQLLENSQKLIESTQFSLNQQQQPILIRNESPEMNTKSQSLKKIQAKKTEGRGQTNERQVDKPANLENQSDALSQNVIIYQGEKFVIPNHYSPPKLKKPVYQEFQQIIMTGSQQKHRRARSDRFN